MKQAFATLLACTAVLACARAAAPPRAPARSAAEDRGVVDLHVDLPYALHARHTPLDEAQASPRRLAAGGVRTLVAPLFVQGAWAMPRAMAASSPPRSSKKPSGVRAPVRKARSRPWPSGMIRMFAGLTSRWITPCRCAWSSAPAICSMIAAARPGASTRSRSISARRSVPST